MNSLIEHELPGTQELRDQMMDMLSDQDLAYKLPNNLTLGELCEEMGQTEQVYIHSFRTLTMDWAYRDSKPDVPNSVESLKAWFKTLDTELKAVLSAIPEEDIHTKHIDRGHEFTPSLYVQFQIYREALLIFYAKASIYLKALEKEYTSLWKNWIG
jgi:hypothetical protein